MKNVNLGAGRKYKSYQGARSGESHTICVSVFCIHVPIFLFVNHIFFNHSLKIPNNNSVNVF